MMKNEFESYESVEREDHYDWLICAKCDGRWANCPSCPGLQANPFICGQCLGGEGVFTHHRYCPTQHTDCPVNEDGEQTCWWCLVHTAGSTG